ncbi:MAG: PaaI family thioesterase [Hyphomonadaceae bacterium]
MNDAPHNAPYVGPIEVTEGPFAGWMTWGEGADPYETAIGPFCFKVETDGRARCAFQPRRDHLNGGGFVHGGALMSFADFSLFSIAHKELEGVRAVTLTCNSEFLSAGELGAMIEAHGEVLRETRSLIFVRGLVTQGSRPLLAFSGTLKKINPTSR